MLGLKACATIPGKVHFLDQGFPKSLSQVETHGTSSDLMSPKHSGLQATSLGRQCLGEGDTLSKHQLLVSGARQMRNPLSPAWVSTVHSCQADELCTHRPFSAQSSLSSAARVMRHASASSTKCPSLKPSRAQLRPRPQSHFSSAFLCSWSLSFHSGFTSGSAPCPVPPTDSTHS